MKLTPPSEEEESADNALSEGKLLCPTVIVNSIMQFVIAFAQTAVTAFLGLYVLEKGLGGAGMFFAIYAIASFLIRIVMPHLVDMFGEKAIVLGSMLYSDSVLCGNSFCGKYMDCLSDRHSLRLCLRDDQPHI